MPQYYVEHSHEAIIDPEEWKAVQDELARRKAIGSSYSGTSVFGAKLKCGDCGSWYGSKVWHSTDRYRTRIWQCNCKFDGGKEKCSTPHLREEDIKNRFLSAYNSLVSEKDRYVLAAEIVKATLTDTEAIDRETDELLREMEVVAGLTRKCIEENSVAAQDQAEYAERYNAYADRYEKLKKRYDLLTGQREERLSKSEAIDRFIVRLAERDDPLTEFDGALWLTVVEYATVNRDGSITFRFYGGTEITR